MVRVPLKRVEFTGPGSRSPEEVEGPAGSQPNVAFSLGPVLWLAPTMSVQPRLVSPVPFGRLWA
jgi:hypothetical protein